MRSRKRRQVQRRVPRVHRECRGRLEFPVHREHPELLARQAPRDPLAAQELPVRLEHPELRACQERQGPQAARERRVLLERRVLRVRQRGRVRNTVKPFASVCSSRLTAGN